MIGSCDVTHAAWRGAAARSHPNGRRSRFPWFSRSQMRIPVRYRALVLLATFAGLRWGELIALRRDSIDLEAVRDPGRGDDRRNWTQERCCLRRPSPGRAAAPSRFLPSWCRSCAGTLSGSRAPEPGSAGSGIRRPQGRAAAPVEFPEDLEQQTPRVGRASRTCIFTICGIRAARSRPRPARTLKELMARLGHSSVRAAMILPARDERPGTGRLRRHSESWSARYGRSLRRHRRISRNAGEREA